MKIIGETNGGEKREVEIYCEYPSNYYEGDKYQIENGSRGICILRSNWYYNVDGKNFLQRSYIVSFFGDNHREPHFYDSVDAAKNRFYETVRFTTFPKTEYIDL